jgi:hypothetical protein
MPTFAQAPDWSPDSGGLLDVAAADRIGIVPE